MYNILIIIKHRHFPILFGKINSRHCISLSQCLLHQTLLLERRGRVPCPGMWAPGLPGGAGLVLSTC